MLACVIRLTFSRLIAFVDVSSVGWFSIAKGIVCIHVVCIHAYSSICYFASVLLEDKHRFKFGGVISGILYHLKRLRMTWIGVLESSIFVFLTRFRGFLHFRV